jgi:hypothetical protein
MTTDKCLIHSLFGFFDAFLACMHMSQLSTFGFAHVYIYDDVSKTDRLLID